ncbi:MAG: heat-inducible transcriptional repressor HrcA [Gammaproteobacteria bacterium]|nr:heat-inducible transcriptional repressor HrcA [Gammaproteobacteria bacterium]
MAESDINERARHILTMLIQRYIRDGQPVGSKTIVEEGQVALSSASVRNIMSDLEEAGYICSPHTSAGRMPTAKGYRFYVDSLLNAEVSSVRDLDELRKQLRTDNSQHDLFESASNLLSSLTHLAGVVSLPKRARNVLRHVEFLPLEKKRVLVILVFNEHEVQNRIIHTDREYSSSELQQAANYLIAQYAGSDLDEIRRYLLQKMHDDRKNLEFYMAAALEVADKAFEPKSDNDFVMAGETNLFSFAETANIDQLKSLFETFTQKHVVLHLLDQCLLTEGVKIFIGQESGVEVFDGCSFVAAPYVLEDRTLGVLGVIGPSRMNYQHVISTVDITARLLSAVLRDEKS